ncbi:hypothetical protein PR001_g7236 [Phytophthora rubi]|uniref:Tyrosinase copper-binding domain-containing protein n=2 Tax=Phytophthora rubi TaxID=129364 RepID=A0A6A3NDJ9_9STRA|nr:hypothetical protein PR001_g7236 [Phytophthora rubi]
MRFPVFELLLFAWLVLSDVGRPVGAQTTCTNRIRKPWGAMTAAEQSLYVEALGVGMQQGYHILFAELASEKASSSEFLRTCGFLYWNRRFVLAYENMLRSLAPKYACVTTPYWDYFADYARFLEGMCDNGGTSLEACSSILRGLGGSQGAVRSVNINGRTISGNCVANAPANSFCESSTITNPSQCAHCIPRANWASTTFPSGFGYAGLGVTLSGASGYRDVSIKIQNGTHNAIHNALSSVLATYVSPADPIFYSIHATVDLLDQIYLECQLGDNVVPTDTGVSRWAFQACTLYPDAVTPTAKSSVLQQWMLDTTYPSSTTAIRAEDHPKLGQFFKPLPSKYWEFVNINQLGQFSYQYQRDDLIRNMQSNGFVCPKRTTPIQASLAFGAVEATTTLDAANSDTSTVRKLAESGSTEADTFESEQQEREYIQQQAIDLLDTTLNATLAVDGTVQTAFTQAELIECQYYNDNITEVEDYSPVFRMNYGLGPNDHARCWQLIHLMETGKAEIQVDDWRDIMSDHFDNSTTGSSGSP